MRSTGTQREAWRPRCLRPALLALLVGLGATGRAVGDDPSKESWPELDLWLRLPPSWRLSMFLAIASNTETDYREGNVVLQADYAWGKPGRLYNGRLLDEGRAEDMKAMLLRGGYLGGKRLGDDSEFQVRGAAYGSVRRRPAIAARSRSSRPRAARARSYSSAACFERPFLP